MTDTRTTRRKGVITTHSHAVRTPDERWAGAKERADREGVSMNRLMNELLEGYRRNVYRLPTQQVETVRVYDETAPAVEEASAA